MKATLERLHSPLRSGTTAAVLSLVVLATVLLLGACRDASAPEQPEQVELQLGVLAPLSGSLATVGQMETDGIRLAVDDFNQASGEEGPKIRLRIDDHQGKAEVGVTAAQKLLSVNDVRVFAVSISSVNLAVQQVLNEAGALQIGLCMHPYFYRDEPSVFRLYEGVEDESRGFIEYFRGLAEQNPEAVTGVLFADVPNVREQLDDFIRPELRELELDFRVIEPYPLSASDFRDQAAKIRAAGITHLAIIGYGFEYPNIYRALEEQQILQNLQIVGGWGFLYAELPAGQLEGTVVVGPEYVFTEAEEVQDFYRRFRERYGYAANFDAAMTYAAVQLLGQALTTGGSADPSALKESLQGLSGVETILGVTAVDEEGASTFSVGVGVFRDGRLRRLAK